MYHYIKKILLLAIIFIMPLKALATFEDGLEEASTATGLEAVSFEIILLAILDVASFGLGALGVLGFIISGLIYVTASGNEDQMQTAKKAMTYSIIGVAIGLLSFAIILLIEEISQGYL
ncbi:MAG: hypothetical protein GF347_01845 [Candidatus Moranbacteria bacterium]|nr:hypothetical protein [Candidatus Moranbacteria bacterium]